MTLKVNEIYGPTVQGEGSSTGRRCAFLRLTGCNLTCSWCDTPYTWDWTGLNGVVYDKDKETKLMETEDVLERLLTFDVPLLVISGGEPMIQQAALAPLVSALLEAGKKVEIETNGTIAPLIKPTQFNVSPKLSNSGVRESKRRKVENLKRYVGRSIFKFVCQNTKDFEEVQAYVDEAEIPNNDVWVMPEGTNADRLINHLALISEEAISRGWNVSGRLHTMTWGLRRGI
jgi:7-carboxy-7-deazaguanine synthase